jgi:hypothetical protein
MELAASNGPMRCNAKYNRDYLSVKEATILRKRSGFKRKQPMGVLMLDKTIVA